MQVESGVRVVQLLQLEAGVQVTVLLLAVSQVMQLQLLAGFL